MEKVKIDYNQHTGPKFGNLIVVLNKDLKFVSSVSARKLKCPSSARLSSGNSSSNSSLLNTHRVFEVCLKIRTDSWKNYALNINCTSGQLNVQLTYNAMSIFQESGKILRWNLMKCHVTFLKDCDSNLFWVLLKSSIKVEYRISLYSFYPWIVSSLE